MTTKESKFTEWNMLLLTTSQSLSAFVGKKKTTQPITETALLSDGDGKQ